MYCGRFEYETKYVCNTERAVVWENIIIGISYLHWHSSQLRDTFNRYNNITNM